ncbi:MAG: Abortive infection protein, partial [Verrucomicrobiales bacterium]|nr:Abortive infection protein [Verrucomicrobiales bacterium]
TWRGMAAREHSRQLNLEVWVVHFTVCFVLSERPWKIEAVMFLVIGLFIAIAIGGLAVQVVEKFGADIPTGPRQFMETVLLTTSYQGLGFLLVTLFLWLQKIPWRDAFGLRSGPFSRVVLLGVTAGLIVLPLAWGLQEFSAYLFTYFEVQTAPQEIIQKLQSGTEAPSHQLYLFVVAVLVAPVIEEILFRGIFYPTIKQLGFRRLAFWGTSIVFAAIHNNKQAFLPLLFFAAILTLLYEETDNLLTPIIAHSTFNAANFLLLIFKDRIMDLFKAF